MHEAVKETVGLRRLLHTLGAGQDHQTLLRCDNMGAIKLIKNPVFHRRTKHIDVKYHFTRDQYEKKEIDVEFIPTEDQVANILTKALPAPQFRKLRHAMGMRNVPREEPEDSPERHKSSATRYTLRTD